jgi:hypothetical protein
MSRAVGTAWGVAVVALIGPVALAGGAAPGPIIVDHNSVDLAAIPEMYLQPAAQLRVLVRHASVGQGITWGLDCLAGAHPTNAACSCFPPDKYDRSRWLFEARAGDWWGKVDDLTQQTAAPVI